MPKPMPPAWLAPVLAALHTDNRATLRLGLQRAYLLALASPAVLGLLLGGMAALLRPAAPLASPWPLLGLGLGLATLAFTWAAWNLHRTVCQSESTADKRRAQVAFALQLASAPLVPWLLGCIALAESWGVNIWLGQWVLGLAVGVAGWRACSWAAQRGEPKETLLTKTPTQSGRG